MRTVIVGFKNDFRKERMLIFNALKLRIEKLTKKLIANPIDRYTATAYILPCITPTIIELTIITAEMFPVMNSHLDLSSAWKIAPEEDRVI
mgnify:CR=1 FL=1